MPTLNSNWRLTILALTVALLCFGYFLLNEALRTRAAKREFARLQPESVTAVRLGGEPITSRDEIPALVVALQHSHWKAFTTKYSTERHRLLLVRKDALPYIVDLRPLADGADLVQIIRFNPANQTEVLLLSGENREIRRILHHAEARPPSGD